MYTLHARIRVKHGHSEQMRDLLLQLSEAAAAEPGTLGIAAFQSDSDPDLLMMTESYTDEAAFAAHKATETFARVTPQIYALFDGTPDVVTGSLLALVK